MVDRGGLENRCTLCVPWVRIPLSPQKWDNWMRRKFHPVFFVERSHQVCLSDCNKKKNDMHSRASYPTFAAAPRGRKGCATANPSPHYVLCCDVRACSQNRGAMKKRDGRSPLVIIWQRPRGSARDTPQRIPLSTIHISFAIFKIMIFGCKIFWPIQKIRLNLQAKVRKSVLLAHKIELFCVL